MPGEDPTTKNLWYSFNQGPIHFVFMSSEHDFTQDSAQYKWIINDLANVDKSVTPWIVSLLIRVYSIYSYYSFIYNVFDMRRCSLVTDPLTLPVYVPQTNIINFTSFFFQ